MAKEMTKYELIDEIAEKACCTKLDARNMLNAFIDTVTEQLVQSHLRHFVSPANRILNIV